MNKQQEQEENRELLNAVMGSFNESGIHDTQSMAQLFGNIKNPFT